MENFTTVIEITDTQIRIAVGNEKDGKINLTHVAERPIKGLISQGNILDFQTLSQILLSMREYKDESTKEKAVINEATVVLPSFGLQIFQSQKTTNVVSAYSTVDKIDIENVVSLVNKENVPSGSEIIDIIPDSFVLDMGRTYLLPPTNEKSNSITINAKIHTLPTRIVSEYKRVVEASRIKVRRLCVSSYAMTELSKHISDIPASYFLVDMGAEITNVSLVGNHIPFQTISFVKGGNDLVNRIVENMKISNEEALDLLKKYGLDERPLTYKPIISTSSSDGTVHKYDPTILNLIIKQFFMEEFFNEFDVSFEQLTKSYPETVKQLPVVFTGGLSKMVGFESLAKAKFANNSSIHYLEPKTIGARDSRFSALIGALYVSNTYKGALSDVRTKGQELSRSKDDEK